MYRNGKEEQEYIGKTLKEVFPFKFTIVQHSNEDIKMSLPEGIQVYYDSRSQITEFIVTPTKTILYFHKIQQAELKFRMGQAAAVYESYKDGVLLRRTAAGEVLLRCSANGQLSRL